MIRKKIHQRLHTHPKLLGEILEEKFHSLGLSHYIAQGKVLNEWKTIVGDVLAKISHAERFEKDTLYVKVESSVWRNELIFYKHEILKKISSLVGEGIVKEIRFR